MRRPIRIILAAAAALALAGVLAIVVGVVNAGQPDWHRLDPAEEPASNPLKGFVPYAGDYPDFPHSMEWSYFPLNSVMRGPSDFDWTVLETKLDEIAGRGHQAALRFYLDYPGEATGIPQYLLDDGLTTYPYTEFDNLTSVIPDYDDPRLMAALEAFIARFGAEYDGDPRIGYLQAGLIGFWGEWHTWPYDGGTLPDRMPSEANRAKVIDDFIAAFPHTELEVRYPTEQNAALDIGYHDDSFALETKPSSFGWFFGDLLTETGTTEKWKTNSIGGELRPELQSCIFSDGGCPEIEEGGDNDFEGSVAFTHVSWLLNHYAFEEGYEGGDRDRALAAARSLGYSFRVTQARFAATRAVGDELSVHVQIENRGVAPFYADWPITLALVDAGGHLQGQATTSWRLATIASGSQAEFGGGIETDGLEPGEYTVVMQGTNPLPNGQPVEFANADQNAAVDGWLSIGTVELTH